MKKIKQLKLLFVAAIMFILPFTVKANTIGDMEAVNIDVNAPVIGEHYSLAKNSTGYTVVSQEWYNEDTGQQMRSSEVFEYGTRYSYSLTINAVSGNLYYNIPKLENSEYFLGSGGTGDGLVMNLNYEFYVGNINDLQVKTGDIENIPYHFFTPVLWIDEKYKNLLEKIER